MLKNKITSKHNISPIEVKSGKNYTFSSLNKFKNKYKEYLSTAYVLHIEDLRGGGGRVYFFIFLFFFFKKKKAPKKFKIKIFLFFF